MITGASIRNFKGISNCDINGLSNVNLFIGKNDVCKSSILEAIYYTLREFTGNHLREIIGRRTNVFFDARELWYRYNITKDTISVALVFDKNATATLRIAALRPISPLVSELEIECKGTAKFEERKSTTRSLSIYNAANWKTKTFARKGFLDNLPRDTGEKVAEYVSNCQFLDSSNKNDINSIEKLFESIESRRKARLYNKYLQSIFEKGSDARITRTSQLDAPDKYRVAIVRNKHKVFVSGLGDGIRYGMQIIGTALISKNTGLFIEEIENNQHPASLEMLIDFLIDFSTKNELQLFVTTHNIRAWEDFFYHFKTEEQRRNQLRSFLVTRDITTGEVFCEQLDLRAAGQMRVREALCARNT